MSAAAPHLDPTASEELRGRLLAAREALLRTVAATDEELATLEAPGPGDSPDHASSVPAALLAARVAGHDKRELDEIAAALRRIGAGTYGLCEACHEPIALARLRAVPAARYCRQCQAAKE